VIPISQAAQAVVYVANAAPGGYGKEGLQLLGEFRLSNHLQMQSRSPS
jgi:hypothetical protein